MTDPAAEPISARLKEMEPSRPASANNNKQLWAAVLSAIVPGAGQLAMAQRRKGVLLMIVFLALIACVWPLRLPRFYPGLILIILAWMGLAIYATWAVLISRPSPMSSRPSKLWLLGLAPLILAAIILLFNPIFRAAGFRNVYLRAASMEPTVFAEDHLVIDRTYYHGRAPATDDLVVVLQKGDWILKRVIAVSGDTVEGIDRQIKVNCKILDEPFVQHSQPPHPYSGADTFGPVTVPAGKLFLMGDNREESMDSRFPEFGLIDVKDVVGKPLYIIRSRTRQRVGKSLN